MDQEKIAKMILEIRKGNNLTQKEFADKFGVTYQAVSKWENGKNIPDIAIIREICKEFNIDINEMLDVDVNKSKDNRKNKYIFILLMLLIFIIILIIQLSYSSSESFEFKTLDTSCDNFNISGSIAYNDNTSSIYISSVEYCGSFNNIKYKKIECNLYDIDDNKEIVISDCNYKNKEPITLEDYLKKIKFNINNYKATCKNYKDNKLELKISATDSHDVVTTYKIPLVLKDNCDNKNSQ